MLMSLMNQQKVTNLVTEKESRVIDTEECKIHICAGREAEYIIEEDDRYYVGIINSNRKSIIMSMDVNVSSKMYDTKKAKSACSTLYGSCQVNLRFPNAQFVTVTTPNNVCPPPLFFTPIKINQPKSNLDIFFLSS